MLANQIKRLSSILPSFTSKNLQITLTTTPKPKPELNEKLLFGVALSDHILEID